MTCSRETCDKLHSVIAIFGDPFKTFFKTFEDRHVCTMNEKLLLGNEASAIR